MNAGTQAMLAAAAAMLAGALAQAPGEPIMLTPDVVKPAVQDAQIFTPPQRVQLTGMLGRRIAGSEANRLLQVNEDGLLEGFRRRPGQQAWIGEHVGKWLHAATLAWANTGDAKLRQKLDRVVTELLKTQEPDGYLGTYVPADRFKLAKGADWDVWVHKYNLMGLCAYHQYTGDPKALEAARKIGDLLCNTFGQEEGKKDLVKSGTHVGMAPTSVLEPMVLLYRLTGQKRYLDFCRYIVWNWEQPYGPKLVSSLTSGKGVHQTANGKAYEMMSCLVGACELYRVTGDKTLFTAALNAWQDIKDKRLYVTGSISQGEHFKGDFELPNSKANVAETCATVTWIQLSAQLLRLTGEARFAEELERTVYNHLAAAQKPDGAMWCYFTELEGKKGYGPGTNCCVSSGPRGMALIPTFAYTTDADGLVVNLLEAGKAELTLADGTKVGLEVATSFPADGKFIITLRPAKSASFALKLRVPSWHSGKAIVSVNDQPGEESEPEPGAYARIDRPWQDGDKITIQAPVGLRVVKGEHGNQGKAALAWGPMVLAFEEGLNPGVACKDVALPAEAAELAPKAQPQPEDRRTWPGDVFVEVQGFKAGQKGPLRLVPFASAGADGSAYQVWLPVR